LLTYFGEEMDKPCEYCDTCEADVPTEATEAPEPFPRQSWVVHKSWGRGLVTGYEGDKITVLFDKVGYKTLAVDFALEQDLLKRLG
jgi:ATP-dependent DNA helicase RecQ